MTRALSSSWSRLQGRCLWALLLIALASVVRTRGQADGRDPRARGLRPERQHRQPDHQVAQDLTDGLRARAKSGAGPYQLATGSDKELIDEKLINNCDNEAIACMAEIGKNLGADYLMYGRLEKKSDGYVVTINLLNVAKKKFEKAKTPLMIPSRRRTRPRSPPRCPKAYNDLTGVSEAGTLVVTDQRASTARS